MHLNFFNITNPSFGSVWLSLLNFEDNFVDHINYMYGSTSLTLV